MDEVKKEGEEAKVEGQGAPATDAPTTPATDAPKEEKEAAK